MGDHYSYSDTELITNGIASFEIKHLAVRPERCRRASDRVFTQCVVRDDSRRFAISSKARNLSWSNSCLPPSTSRLASQLTRALTID
jgi:hypothetical protein